ncbi:MAG: hypothetical protein OIF55_07030 [Amphritea sp.]|nr:hypothetical protein [Amphritea sp.]
MKDVALITLHGMGREKDGYYADLEAGLKKQLGDQWYRVSFQNVYYARVLQQPQDRLWQAMMAEPENSLDGTKLRQFLLFGFGDAGSLEHSAHKDKVKYIKVQEAIQSALKKAYIDLGGDPTKPVIIIAQSLGCQVISNYLWDAEHDKFIFENPAVDDPDELVFLKLKSLSNLMTTGCNIPLFISGIENRECFAPPNDYFRWDNFYDADDVLGWPLKQLGSSFSIVHDHDINAGGLFTAWNTFSHGKYWSDKDVIKPLARALLDQMPA